jgi:MYXO-CTERM domain-containing protein
MKTKPLSALTFVLSTGLFSPELRAQLLFSDNFDTDHTANWTVNPSAGTHPVNIFFDYSTVGIPSAPNSGGSTFGMRLQANTAGATFGGVSVSPTGQSFTGDYRVEFDMWLNYNGQLNGGGNGSTQVTGAGIGTAGTTPQWAGGTQDSVHFGATGDGGSTVDYRAYSTAAPAGYPDASTVFNASGAGNRNNTHAYYAGFGGASAPAAQLALFSQQTNSTPAGAQGFAWRDVTITKVGNTVSWAIDGLNIATVDLSTVTLGGNNILFNHYDINATTSTDPNAPSLLLGLIDNVRVSVVPEPSAIALGLLGVAGLLLARRRR